MKQHIRLLLAVLCPALNISVAAVLTSNISTSRPTTSLKAQPGRARAAYAPRKTNATAAHSAALRAIASETPELQGIPTYNAQLRANAAADRTLMPCT
jgi:hypothetical protein